jgi:hypothetical protein
MKGIRRHIDPASLTVILITLLLFVVALAVKGLGHGLLLEAGVFLVSVKLILMAYKNSVATKTLKDELAVIRSTLARIEGLATKSPPADPGRSGPPPSRS